jgi:hypothetical protein
VISIALVALSTAGAVALASRGAPGPRGPRGPEGPVGEQGRAGERGPGSYRQDISINWQNGKSEGRDREGFFAPGIGSGEVVCNEQAQQVVFEPYDQGKDTAMLISRAQDKGFGAGTELTVRAAKREEGTGNKFNEGMNFQGFERGGRESVATGMFTGLISSRGDRESDGDPGPAPTSFKLVWHWTFDDGSSRCYVAATFLTRYGDAF